MAALGVLPALIFGFKGKLADETEATEYEDFWSGRKRTSGRGNREDMRLRRNAGKGTTEDKSRGVLYDQYGYPYRPHRNMRWDDAAATAPLLEQSATHSSSSGIHGQFNNKHAKHSNYKHLSNVIGHNDDVDDDDDDGYGEYEGLGGRYDDDGGNLDSKDVQLCIIQ